MKIGYISAQETFETNGSDGSLTAVENVSITVDRPSRSVDEDAVRSDTAEWQVVVDIADCSAAPNTASAVRAEHANDIHRYGSLECPVGQDATDNTAPNPLDRAFDFSSAPTETSAA